MYFELRQEWGVYHGKSVNLLIINIYRYINNLLKWDQAFYS